MLKNFKNIIDFYLRKNFQVSRKFIGEYSPVNQEKTGIFDSEAQKLETELLEKYPSFKELKNNSLITCYRENLYVLDILDRFFPKLTCENPAVLDIGCKNWVYVNALHSYFSQITGLSKLDGIELDANRLYTDFYSRKDYANYYIKNLSNTNYIENDLMNLDGSYDCITWFLPFVLKKPHQNWGLPDKFFNPEKMLNKAFNLLKPQGVMFIINQGINEAEEQTNLFKKSGIDYVNFGLITSSFLQFNNERYLFVVQKFL